MCAREQEAHKEHGVCKYTLAPYLHPVLQHARQERTLASTPRADLGIIGMLIRTHAAKYTRAST